MKLDIKNIDKNKIFFTSDTHFYHSNIIKFCDRPYDNVEDMNEDIITKWNEKVEEDSIIFMLGDFSMKANNKYIKETISRLNGKKYLILGNHDRMKASNEPNEYWKLKQDMIEITVLDDEIDNGYQPITLCHYPMVTWNHSHRGSWQLFGHVHGMFDNRIKHSNLSSNQLDVGVDSHEFEPWSYEEVKVKITQQNIKKVK